MRPKIEMGIRVVRSTLRAASLGKKLWAIRKHLPHAKGRAVPKAVRMKERAFRKRQGRRAVQGIRGMACIALMIRKKYF